MMDKDLILRPTRRILKKMGYFRDQEGIMNRYLRESAEWEAHLEKTRDVILNKIGEKLPERIIVLGSGWLLDFPLEEAWEICRDIELVDIIHPPQILNRIRKFPGIRTLGMDLSGGMIAQTYYGLKNRLSLEEINRLTALPLEFNPDQKNTLFISLNVMSQLDSLPSEYIVKKTSVSYHDLLEFRSGIQERHLEFLKSVKGLLITDYAEIYRNLSNGSVNEKQILITGLERILPEEEWKWEFDSQGIYRENCSTSMRVLVVSF